jgi:hypothetical protein
MTAISRAAGVAWPLVHGQTAGGRVPTFVGPALGTYAYNTLGSVQQFYDWLGTVPAGAFGDAHVGRGADKATLTEARADWTGSVGYVIDASGWVGPGRTLTLAIPMLCKFATFADANAGAYDADYRKIFGDAKGRLKPTQKILYARVGWEFNSPVGGFQYWGTGNDPDVQAQYVQLFRRIWGIAQEFSDSGFDILFDWVMNPGAFPFIPCYPGDQYVARIGMDCYPGLNDKAVYRPPAIVGPLAQVAIWNEYRTQQYGMDDAVAFAKSRGKPFIVPEFAYEFDDGQAGMDAAWTWFVANAVSVGWWNDHDAQNVLSGISGTFKTTNPADGQNTPDLPNTGACVRYRWNRAQYPTQPMTPPYTAYNRASSDLTTWQQSGARADLVSAKTGPTDLPVYLLHPLTTTAGVLRILQNLSWTKGVPITVEMYVRPAGYTKLFVNGFNGPNTGKVNFDLSAISITSGQDGNATIAAAVGGTDAGWLKIVYTGSTQESFAYPLLQLNSVSDSGEESFAGDPAKGIQFSGVRFLV